MRLLYTLKDEEFPYEGIDHVRDISRGVVYNDKHQIAIIHLLGDDIFGHRDYYELPGGGREKGETFKECFIREMKEELGAEVDNIKEIGRVVDFYNLIHRENNNHFYLAHGTISYGTNLNNYEKKIFESIKWVDIDEAIRLYESVKRTPIANLVINRELPILKIAKKMMEKGLK